MIDKIFPVNRLRKKSLEYKVDIHQILTVIYINMELSIQWASHVECMDDKKKSSKGRPGQRKLHAVRFLKM